MKLKFVSIAIAGVIIATPTFAEVNCDQLLPARGEVYESYFPLPLDFYDPRPGEPSAKFLEIKGLDNPFFHMEQANSQGEITFTREGIYRISRTVVTDSGMTFDCSGSFEISQVCQDLPKTPPFHRGAPDIFLKRGESVTGAKGSEGVMTYDGSFSAFEPIVIYNEGNTDLVIYNIELWMDNGRFKITPYNFEPYMKIPPGGERTVGLIAEVTDAEALRESNILTTTLAIYSNDPDTQNSIGSNIALDGGKIAYQLNINGIFESYVDIPSDFIPDTPDDNPVVANTDRNGDGMTDTTDVVGQLIGN